MAGNRTEERVGRAMVFQAWRAVAFLHWRIDAEVMAGRLPEGLVPDVLDGSAWLGLTPFRVERYSVLDLPAVPAVSSFNETNLRTYVRAPDGRDGLWFFSLDVDSLVNACGGRVGGLPYFLSDMSVRVDGHVRYRCRRRLAGPAHHDIVVVPGGPVSRDRELAELLTGRWRAYHTIARQLVEVPVDHERLRDAELVAHDETLLERAGFDRPRDRPLVHFADGADARLGPPRLAPPQRSAGRLRRE
jgi:hypothetical protein